MSCCRIPISILGDGDRRLNSAADNPSDDPCSRCLIASPETTILGAFEEELLKGVVAVSWSVVLCCVEL